MSTNEQPGADKPSEWQQRIEGEWHGRPSLFDPEGNHVGYENVSRASRAFRISMRKRIFGR